MAELQVEAKALVEYDTKILPEDTLAEAGRKVLLSNLINMREHEAGSITGTDIENIHQMRVATRRMRSAFVLFGPYFKPKPIRPFVKSLKAVAGLLGSVRDLDVMIEDLTHYGESLTQEEQASLQEIISHLTKERRRAHRKLVKHLNSKTYKDFIQAYDKFLHKPGKGAQPIADQSLPYQVRHLLPTLMHEHLANVRAYDTVLQGASIEALHALRIEFKRLRYATTYFKDVLGKSINDFIEEIKIIQDDLGRINDNSVAQQRITALLEAYTYSVDATAVAKAYLTHLETEADKQTEDFIELWQHFNSRTVQRKLANALLVLR